MAHPLDIPRRPLKAALRAFFETHGFSTRPSSSPCLGGWVKRAADIPIALLALVMLAPLMLLTALLIRLVCGGPVIFGHRRVGQNGRPFQCLKFRTMVRDADTVLERHLAGNPEAAREWEENRKLRDDPRVTTLGRVLRASSIDELPQFINVLRGEMSCVGPRPIVADELAHYGSHAAEYFKARPGLTGLWQVSGRSSLPYPERVALDCAYVREWSLRNDLIILLKTIPAVIRYDRTS